MNPPNPVLAPAGQKPTRARHWVVVFAVTLAILAYIDRVCISQAAPIISRDLGLSKAQMGLVFSAFGLAYALFEIPGGWLGDWMGPRRVLMRIVMWWSIFTAATGGVWSFTSLWVTRFLFGAGEAGCFPNLTKAFTTWLPQDERVKAQGIMWMFARWGGAFTPPLVILTFQYVSWRLAFMLFGGLGIIWAVFFYSWFRDNPRDQPAVNAAELAMLPNSEGLASGHGDVPWKRMVSSRSVWLLWAQYFCISYPWYFYITWLPTYLQEYRHLTPRESSTYAIVPLFFGGFGNLMCGFLSSRLAHWTGSVKTSRRITGTVGFFGAAMFLLLSMHLHDPFWGMAAMGFASFCNDLVMPGAWGACMDVGGRYAGTLSGSMNMMGNLAGFVAPALGGLILQRTGGDWNLFLYTMVGMYLLGTLCWPFIDPVAPIDRD
jgi:MFS transporter, ACS family, glucarate transporter